MKIEKKKKSKNNEVDCVGCNFSDNHQIKCQICEAFFCNECAVKHFLKEINSCKNCKEKQKN
jgi:hypothetical protein